MADKYQGYDHSIATILRGFDEWAEKEIAANSSMANHDAVPALQAYCQGINLGCKKAKEKLIALAGDAQREIDECRAAVRE